MEKVFVLLVVYQLKHFLADYPLQGRFMLGKFKDGWGFFLLLAAHVAVHGLFTLTIAMCYKPRIAVLCACFDMVIHFGMDRIKAAKKYLGRFKPVTAAEYMESVLHLYTDRREFHQNRLRENNFFWWAVGFDQMVHHLTHYTIIFFLVRPW